jgi:hypothetical protein
MNNVLQWVLIGVLSSVIILILVYNAAPTLFKFDFLSFVTQTPNLGDIFQPKDLTAASQYEGYELSYDGMILEKDAGYDDIDQVLKANISIPDCSICPSSRCQSINLGGINTYKCDECGICNGISQPNRFKNCLGCNITTETCILCADTDKEYVLCNKIKEECILSQYREKNKQGCYIVEIPHNDGTSFNINTLLNVLSSCRSESLRVNVGNDFMKELCYFSSSSISYYDFRRPSDFYLNYTINNAISGKDYYNPSVYDTFLYNKDLNLTAFTSNGEENIENYRIYVAVNGTPNTEYTIRVVYVQNLIVDMDGDIYPTIEHMYELGKIKTDSYGFGEAEFDNYGDIDTGGGKIWRQKINDEPTKNKFNAVMIVSMPINKASAIFYANSPTNVEWTNELRYSNCNFDTDIETYLKDRPWWVPNNNNLNSSWYVVSGNPDSPIKVFYDSSMPGGGNSLNRGNIKIQLGKLDVDFQRNCMFNVYVSSQDAFAGYEGENILNLNDFLKDFSPINVYRTSSFGNDQIILYNYFEFDLDKEYTVEEIKSAIKTGFRNWEQNLFPYLSSSTNFEWLKNNNGIYQGLWTSTSRSLVYENDCWDNSLNLIMKNLNGKFIIGNCQNGVCKGKIKIRIAFKYIKPDNLTSERDFLYPTVTFCDASNAPAAPPNPCSSYASDNDCIFAGCRWCPSYGGIDNSCGDRSDGMLDPCVGTECFTTAQCTNPSDPLPTCTWRDLYVDILKCGLACCDDTKTCTVPASMCY